MSAKSDYVGNMERELRANLLLLANLYASKNKLALTTLGRQAAGDWRFFSDLSGSKAAAGFTVRKYDEVVEWFSAKWPDGTAWPATIARPFNSRQRRKAKSAAA